MPGTRLYDRSKPRLKKELTQIQKAARVLRDPGTSSSWKSPLSSTRSATASLSAFNDTHIRENPLFPPSKESGREKEKRVVLYNWRSNSNNKSSSEKSLARIDLDGGNHNDDFEIGSSSLDNCGNAVLVSVASPKMARREMGKVRFRKTHSSSLMQKQRRKRLQRVVVERKSLNSKMVMKGIVRSSPLRVAQDDSVGLIDQSDVTEEYYNSDDLHPSSATSSLLSRLMHKNFSQSSVKYSTPALSTSSFNRYFNNRNYSNIGSCDGTTISFNDLDSEEEDQLDLPGSQGCGIPCYWSRRSTPKCTGKQRLVSRAAQGNLPLLNDFDGGESSFRSGNSDDELSTNFGELDLEGVSRLEGRRLSSSCRSRDEIMLETIRSLSQRYRPVFFNELVGQNVVVQSLATAITRRRIAPVYLFHGPRGTGKTSTAKIFAAALNCSANQGNKPCGNCQDCANYISYRSRDIVEVDGKNKKGIESIRYLLKRIVMAPPSAISSYKVFVIDECHLLPSKSWEALLKFLEEPIPKVVFIFITTDVENVPRAMLSRCQKHMFSKIKEVDIVRRLQRIADEENLEVEPDALELVALNGDGSLRDAETMLEQLSLLGKRITATLVNELVGVISDEKLLELLELALSSNTAETVKRARELLDSGADPSVLMSQLASLIMDIIAGTYLLDGAKCNNSFFGGRDLTEAELEKLKRALKLLSEAEKQLRVSSERSTWFTATLLQLGSVTSPDFTLSGSSRRQSSRTTDEDHSTASKDDMVHVQNSCHRQAPMMLIDVISSNSKTTHRKSIHSVDTVSSRDDMVDGDILFSERDMEKLEHLWLECIGRCHYEKLRHLLQTYGKLVSISEVDGVLVAYIAFDDEKMKVRAERYLISITNSFETALRRNVEVRILVLPDGLIPTDSREAAGSPHSSGCKQTEPINNGEKLDYLTSPLLDQRSLALIPSRNGNPRERRREMPMQRIESIIREQRLETAWLQAIGKGTPRSIRPERNQVLPQDNAETTSPADLSSHHWDDELNHEIKVLKVNGKTAVRKDQADTKSEHHPISPSLLHQSSCAGGSLSMDYQGYESGPGGKGCNILFCWNSGHPRRGKAKQGTSAPPNKRGRFLCLGERRKSRYG